MEICRKITGIERLDGAYLIHTDNADIKVYFMTDEIIRVRASFDKKFIEESYILEAEAWPDRLDGVIDRKKIKPLMPEPETTENRYTFRTEKLRIEFDVNPICIRLYDSDGTELYSSLSGNPFTYDSNHRVTHYSRMNEDDCFYGFGEKAGHLNKNKKFLR